MCFLCFSLSVAALHPPLIRTSSQPLNASAAATERSCGHQTPVISVVNRRRQTPPPAVSLPLPPLPIAIFAAVASPPPRQNQLPRSLNARRLHRHH